MLAERLRIGVVGLGYWGPNLLRVIAESGTLEPGGVCDLSEERLEIFSRRYPGLRATSDIDDLLDDPDLHGVAIATPTGTHFEQAFRCLKAGKHVLVEKPLAASSHEVAQLIALAEERDLVLMCGHTFLYSPPVQKVKDLVEGGSLGELFFVSSSRVNLGPYRRDVSVVWDLGPHDFSILLYWLGEVPESVSCVGRDAIRKGVADVGFVILRFPSGIVANVEMSWLAPTKLRRTVVVGRERMVVYDDTSQEAVRVFDRGIEYEDPETFGEFQLSYRMGDVLSPQLDRDEPLAAEIEDFAASIRAGRAPAGHLDLAHNVVRILEAADSSLADGGRPTELGPAPGATSLRAG